MSLYTKEAIKICPPEETVNRCLNIIRKFNLEENGVIQYEFRNEEQFGVWAANLLINHRLFYELFPDKFPYLKDSYNFWFKKVSGKGVSKIQCTASLFMEMFERISIEFKIYEILEKRIVKKYSDYLNEIKNSPVYKYLEIVLSTKNKNDDASFIEAQDIVNNSSILFPLKLLFHSSNGYTAGNEGKEAIVHAIFEIVERFTQTLFVIKQSKSLKEDIKEKLLKQIYGYDIDLYDSIKNFNPFIVSIDSIVREFPDLKGVIDSIGRNFTKFEIVDISFSFNGVKFYSYIIRQGREDTNFKLFASGGCHFDQRIAILRALTEASQGYVPYEKLNQSWNGYIFTRKFIDIVFDSELPVKDIEKDKRVFNEMEDIYNECVKAFKSIIVFDCTNKEFGVPVYSVYIPELYSKSFLWSNIFSSSNVGDLDLIKYIGENNLFKIYNFITEKSISGIETLFFLENHNQLEDSIRERLYYLYLSYTNDKDMFEYIKNRDNNDFFKDVIKERIFPEISTTTSIDSIDEDSFIYFYKILTKNKKSEEDYLYLIENYIRMGLIDYSLHFAEKNNLNIDEIIEEGLSLYEELLEYVKFNNMFKRAGDISKILYTITKDNNYLEMEKDFINKHIELEKKYNKFISQNSDGKTTIAGLKGGDTIENFTFISAYQKEDFVYRLNFSNNKKDNIVVDISLIPKSNFKSVTTNGFYLDYNIGLFAGDKKKFINKFIELIERL